MRPAVSVRSGFVNGYDSTYSSRQASIAAGSSSSNSRPIHTKPHHLPLNPHILSDDYYHGLFAAPHSPPADLSFFEDGLATTDPADDAANLFTFDSMVDLDAGNGTHSFFPDDDHKPLQADFPHPPAPASPALQPCLGAPSSGRDGSGNAS